ncbi:MAG: VWA domain-containing protein, partial [Flavobacteriaceae bacterium]|nr:VWA domain-containing protein [Flavobacteriaceae bacterium]
MYILEQQSYFYLLALIPLVVMAFLLLQWWKKRAQAKFAENKFLKQLAPDKSIFKPVLKLIMICLTIFSIVIALVNPKIGTKIETVKREGIDIVFALDVSRSMLAEDIAPNRLEKSKQLINQIINDLVGDRIGIVVYAATAHPLLPITTDYNAAKMFLQSANTDMLSSQGTAIKDALTMSQSFFNDEAQTNKLIIVISDGEDHEGNVAETALSLAEAGIKVFTIGVGKPNGGPIPLKEKGIVTGYIKDGQGETVISKLNEPLLMELAQQAGGYYQNGNNTQEVVSFIKDKLGKMNKTEFEAKEYSDFKDQFQW